MPIVGYGGRTVNVLRLFSARASDEFDIGIFNSGDYIARRAAQDQHRGDLEGPLSLGRRSTAGRELRLLQEYFLVACSVRDIVQALPRDARLVRRLRGEGRHPDERHASRADRRGADAHVHRRVRHAVGSRRGRSRSATCGYTNHTLLPEALEKWPFELIERVLPRHLQIIQEINRRLLAEVERRFPGDIGDAAARLDRRGRRAATCAWPTWPWPAATRSTAWRRCTRSW